jgi:glutathione S-transferase
MAKATLSIASKNYGSWSLRGWLLCKMASLDFEEVVVSSDDPSTRARARTPRGSRAGSAGAR